MARIPYPLLIQIPMGMVAPFLEGSHYHAPLVGFLAALWDHSVARQARP